MNKIQLLHGDCLELMKTIPENSIDLILTDLPYGTTACKWDNIINFEEMWKRIRPIIKTNSAILLFGTEPFSSLLRSSYISNFKYDWYWEKNKASAHLLAKKQPMRILETISVFGLGSVKYYPQGLFDKVSNNSRPAKSKGKSIYYSSREHEVSLKSGYPKNLLKYSKEHKPIHPTQKPVALLEYLIKTYTLEGETVLDFTMGSGSTGVACKNLNRNFIGIEKDDKYFEIAKNRITGGQNE